MQVDLETRNLRGPTVRKQLMLIAPFLCCCLSAQSDTANHSAQFVTVDEAVKLEVLDWGGTGRPLLLLAGAGDTAHVFDRFAPKLIGDFHVLGITRRGFGLSSRPATGYSADQLGDDVLTVIDALRLGKPVLAGHSIAGQELSSVGSRFPDKIAGLIYLDAAYPYAFYDSAVGDLSIDFLETQRKLELLRTFEVKTPGRKADPRQAIRQLLENDLPNVVRELADLQEKYSSMSDEQIESFPWAPPGSATQDMEAGEKKYQSIPGHILAIFALPHDLGAKASATAKSRDEGKTRAQADAFEKGVPSARVVRLPNANHYVFRSNEDDVIREMKSFMGTLPAN